MEPTFWAKLVLPSKLHVATLVVGIAVVYLAAILLPVDLVRQLAVEDGPVEYAGALFFLFASVFFLRTYRTMAAHSDDTHLEKYYFFLLALAMFFAFGEEISWGQRIIGFETPPAVAEVNVQNEFNIHNLEWLHASHVFSLFLLIFAFVIPFIATWRPLRRMLSERLYMPIVPLETGVPFLINFLASKSLQLAGYGNIGISEIKESILAFFCLVIAIQFFWSYKAKSSAGLLVPSQAR